MGIAEQERTEGTERKIFQFLVFSFGEKRRKVARARRERAEGSGMPKLKLVQPSVIGVAKKALLVSVPPPENKEPRKGGEQERIKQKNGERVLTQGRQGRKAMKAGEFMRKPGREEGQEKRGLNAKAPRIEGSKV
jgi:hypothetical protein